jgi:hypothetical protein
VDRRGRITVDLHLPLHPDVTGVKKAAIADVEAAVISGYFFSFDDRSHGVPRRIPHGEADHLQYHCISNGDMAEESIIVGDRKLSGP